MDLKMILTGIAIILAFESASAQSRGPGNGPGNGNCRRYVNADSICNAMGNRCGNRTVFRANRSDLNKSYACGRRSKSCRRFEDLNKNGICDYYESQSKKK